MLVKDKCKNIPEEEVNFEKVYELLNEEGKEQFVFVEKKIINFLLQYYKNCEEFTLKEIEYLNNFLKVIIKKFIDEKNISFVNILLVHFKNIPSSFINIKLKDNIFYIEEIRNFFLLIFDLSSYLKKYKNNNSEKINFLIISIINFLNLFLVNILKLIESKYYEKFYIKIIIDGRILEILTNLYFNKELENEKIVHSLFLLTEFKEFDEEIYKCGVINLFMKLLLSNEYINYLIIQIIINIVDRNIKIIKLLINDELIVVNYILDKIYSCIKKECYDYACINLLKLLSYIIEGNCIDLLVFFHNRQYIKDDEINFFNRLNKIIKCIRGLIMVPSMINTLEEKNELFHDFLCILFCVLRNLIELITNQNGKIIFKSINVNSFEYNKNQINADSKKLIHNILNLSLDFLTGNNFHFYEDSKMLHLLCFDIINGMHSCCFTSIIDHTIISEKIIKEIHSLKDKNMNNSYLYVKYFESLFYICFNNEALSKESLKENFIISIEKDFYKINKNMATENINKQEVYNLLKLYHFGIISIFIKNNLKSEVIRPFINYVVLEELKRKKFLLQNDLYYLVFLKFLNMIILNNLYEFRKFIENDFFEDLLKIFKSSKFHFKVMILKILIQWIEKKIILEEIKNYIKKNKMIFSILLELWKEIQKNNNNNSNLYINEFNNIRSTIYHIFKALTNNFTKDLNYFSKNEEFLNNFKCIMIFEENSILDVYNSIKEQIFTKEIVILESDKLILSDKIKMCNEKIENIKKKFDAIIDINNKKDVNDLEKYYNYLREQNK